MGHMRRKNKGSGRNGKARCNDEKRREGRERIE